MKKAYRTGLPRQKKGLTMCREPLNLLERETGVEPAAYSLGSLSPVYRGVSCGNYSTLIMHR